MGGMIMQIPNIPFTICVLAPLCPSGEAESRIDPVTIDLYSLDDTMEKLSPSLYIPVSRELCPSGGLTLRFSRMKDFKPEGIVRNNEYLKSIDGISRYIAEALNLGESSINIAGKIKTDWPQAALVIDVNDTETPSPKNQGKSQVDDILSMVAAPATSRTSSPAGPRRWKARCDEIISSILETIFNNVDFKTCEAAWRGVEILLRQGTIKEGTGLSLRIIPVSPDGLEQILERLADDCASDPPNLFLIDVPFDNTPRSTGVMEKIISVADTLMAPTACWITPGFFHLGTWQELRRIPYIKNHFDNAAYAKWRKLGNMPGAEWVAVTCNRFLARAPYGQNDSPSKWPFKETEPLWISPVWALATLICRSINEFGWPTRFTDYTAVALTDLGLADAGNDVPTCTEMILPEDRIAEFVSAGIIPLQSARGTERAFIPKENTLGDASFKYQLFIDRILAFLWWCRNNLDAEIRQGSIEANLTTAFDLFWQKTGQPTPDDLTVTAGTAEDDDLIPITIRMTAPRSILPDGPMLELTYHW